MSAAISPLPDDRVRRSGGHGAGASFAEFARRNRAVTQVLARVPRVAPDTVAAVAAILLLGWGFAGSFLMGLRTPASATAGAAQLWLGGAGVIVGIAAVMAVLGAGAEVSAGPVLDTTRPPR